MGLEIGDRVSYSVGRVGSVVDVHGEYVAVYAAGAFMVVKAADCWLQYRSGEKYLILRKQLYREKGKEWWTQ